MALGQEVVGLVVVCLLVFVQEVNCLFGMLGYLIGSVLSNG